MPARVCCPSVILQRLERPVRRIIDLIGPDGAMRSAANQLHQVERINACARPADHTEEPFIGPM